MSTVLAPKRPDGLLKRSVFFEYREGTDPSLPTIVILPGIQDNPWAAARLIATEYSIVIVHYPLRSFSYASIADEITAILRDADITKVIVLGISLGGLLGCRLVQHWRTRIVCSGIVLWNAPRRMRDLVHGSLAVATSLLPGKLLNPWSRQIFAALGGKEPPAAIEPEANIEQISEDHAYGLAEQASAYIQKLRFIMQSSSADFPQACFLPVAYVRSSDDEVVKPFAFEYWESEFQAIECIEIAGPHCSFSRAPARCKLALMNALTYVQL